MQTEKTTNGSPDKAMMTMVQRRKPFDWVGLKKKVEKEHWRILRVTIQLREKLHAGKPAQIDAARAMLNARGLNEVVEAREAERPAEERAVEVVDEGLCEFHRRPEKPGLWWPTNNFKACIKENWSVLGYRMDATPRSKRAEDAAKKAEAAEESKKSEAKRKAAQGDEKEEKKPKKTTIQGSRGALAEGVFVSSTDATDRDWVKVGDAPDGIDTNPSHTIGPKGPQSSIKRNEYVLRPTLVFDVMIAKAVQDKIPEESFADMLIHAQEHGIGANRSQGMGKFDVVSVDEIT